MNSSPIVTRYETNQGAKIYRFPLNGFPGFMVYAYLILVGNMVVLIDTGTNFHSSNQDLEAGMKAASEQEGTELGFAELTHIFISHGHIDHFAGLAFVGPQTEALIAVHELDYRILMNFQERKVVVYPRLEEFLHESGVSEDRVPHIMDMYMSSKALFDSSRVDLTYQAEKMKIGPFEFLNVPGHSAGAVVIRLHDVLFTGDHVLSKITPHMAPERLSLNSGLSHYLESLARVKEWADDVKIGLAGHEEPIRDLPARVEAIAAEHLQRLIKLIEILEKPATISSISKDLFGDVHGYNVLLALEEAGAHVEYLYKLGFIGIDNLQEVEANNELIPIRYRARRPSVDLIKVFPDI